MMTSRRFRTNQAVTHHGERTTDGQISNAQLATNTCQVACVGLRAMQPATGGDWHSGHATCTWRGLAYSDHATCTWRGLA
eukprot:364146-Chlamydomonas_euryale.AAC.6